jgi:hypothetical protein
LESGYITQVTFDRKGPALLFENIKAYKDMICTKSFTGIGSNISEGCFDVASPKINPLRSTHQNMARTFYVGHQTDHCSYLEIQGRIFVFYEKGM